MDKERKVMIKEFINTFGIKNVDDLNEALKEMFSNTLENMLEAELDNHLGYTKYNYKNKSKSNSRNGIKRKKLFQSTGQRQSRFHGIVTVRLNPRLFRSEKKTSAALRIKS